jgi:subtilisin family serine protease
VARHGQERPSAIVFLAVAYDRTIAGTSTSAITQRERQARASLVRTFDFPRLGTLTRVVRVAAADLGSAQAALRAQFGVRSVDIVGSRRYRLTVTAPFFPNDPYFNGFPASSGHAATFHVAPYEESASVPGQWDMHAISLEHAFAYSQTGNGSGIVNPLALGSASIKIAIIDTGEDPNHPELQSKLAAQKCFITDPNGRQSTSNFSTDPDGHGTDVSGIAAAATNNAFGVTGAGGNAMIDAYRVFPTPDDNCLSANPTDAQCSASSTDIVSAIEDAIANHANIISMSLGGGGCTSGKDQDPLEGQAIADAIAANIVVVAAAGNDGTATLEAPACVSGVIAAGATSLADGQKNGSGVTSGTAKTPVEYVASYSDHGSPATALHSANAWGIVAPGGDPTGNSSDSDDLHWILNLWTSTPFDSTDAQNCSDDYPNLQGMTPPLDCATFIAGTSMSTPHIAGAAALILSVNASYQSPAKMKQLLCATADDIKDPNEGCGRLNVYRAMATALGDPKLP